MMRIYKGKLITVAAALWLQVKREQNEKRVAQNMQQLPVRILVTDQDFLCVWCREKKERFAVQLPLRMCSQRVCFLLT